MFQLSILIRVVYILVREFIRRVLFYKIVEEIMCNQCPIHPTLPVHFKQNYLAQFFLIFVISYSLFLLLISSQKMSQQTSSQNIAYIISQNFSGQHIEQLIEEFNKSKIPVRLQKDHESLGVVLDRRYFVVVDNLQGTITLGPWFSSLLLFIVGYPRKGSNKKNYYCTIPRQVISKYKQFSGLPAFVRKSFLSSTIIQKSVLKSVISSSMKSNQISQSQATSKKNKITNQNQIKSTQIESQIKIKAHQNSKLFLFLSVRDSLFNKWLLKIARNNRKKYVLIQSIEDLSLLLTVNRGAQNFLLIKDNQYQTILKQNLDQLKIILYSDKKYQVKQENWVGVCSSHVQIVQAIRKIGFQVQLLKDTDRSILKYDNPIVKQVKSNTSKKIIWDCQKQNQKPQADLNLKKQVRSITNKQNGHILNQSEPLTKQLGSDSSFQSKVYTVLRSTSTQSAPQGKNKRVSIESDLRRNQEGNNKGKPVLEYNLQSQPANRPRYMSTLSSNQTFLNSPVPITVIDDSTKPKQQKTMSQKQPISQTGGKVEQKKIRVKRIRMSQNSKIDSKKSESNQVSSIISNSSSLRTSKIFKKKVCQPDLFMSTYEQKDEDKNTRMKRQISISSKTSLAFRQSDRQIDRLSLTGTLSSQKDEKVKITKKKCSLKKSIIEAQQKLLNNSKHQLFQTLRKQYQIFNNVQSCRVADEKKGVDAHILLWKQFNFQIENNKNYLKEELKNKKLIQLPDIPFYTLDQFRRCIQKNKEKKIFILIDEEQMYSYLKVLHDSMSKKQALGLYVFQKMQKNQNSFISGIKTILKTNIFKELRPIVKPVLFNQYFDEGLQAAKQIISILVHHLR